MKAPNGKLYNIPGPDGATDDEIKQEILKQHPDAAAAPETVPQAPPSEIPAPRNPVVDYLDKHGRELATLGGGFAGGLIATPAAVVASVPTAGLGGIATEAAGAGLGAGIGGQAYDVIKNSLAPKAPVSPLATAKTVAQDVGVNALGTVGGHVVGEGLGLLANKVAPLVAKTGDELRKLSQIAYKKAEDAGVEFSPVAYKSFVDDVRETFRKNGFNIKLHPNASAALDELVTEIQKPIKSFEGLEVLRRVINNAASAKGTSEDELRLIYKMKSKLDDFVRSDNFAANDNKIISGKPEIAIPAIEQARKLWSQMSKSDTIQNLIERADLAKANPLAKGPSAEALQNEFRSLAKSKTRMRGFSDAERQAIEDFAKGKNGVGVLQLIGSLAPGMNPAGLLKLAGYVGSSAGTGVVPAVLTAGTSLASKAAANKLAASNAARVAALMRGGQRAAVPSSNAMARFATRGVANLNSPSNALAQ